jgi:hypothetical protein
MKKGTLIPDRAILSSARDNDLRVFVFLSNHEKGLLVQIISFEKGKYSIFESKEATFWAEQFRRTILWEMGVAAPIDYADEEERNKAERHALRVTQSLAPFRGLLRRDQIVVGIGLILLATDYLLWVLNIGMDHLGFALLTVLGVGSSFPTQDLELCAYGRKSDKVVLHQPLETGSVSSPQFVSKLSQ